MGDIPYKVDKLPPARTPQPLVNKPKYFTDDVCDYLEANMNEWVVVAELKIPKKRKGYQIANQLRQVAKYHFDIKTSKQGQYTTRINTEEGVVRLFAMYQSF
tara:strand:- start:571 stop:876 length:306 start_codon:yes stop_codon:yes gene_type:complete